MKGNNRRPGTRRCGVGPVATLDTDKLKSCGGLQAKVAFYGTPPMGPLPHLLPSTRNKKVKLTALALCARAGDGTTVRDDDLPRDG